MIKTCLNENAQPNKIKLLFNEILPSIDKVTNKHPQEITTRITLDRFLESKEPIEKIQENIKVLPSVIENMIGKVKEFDVIDFVTKNVNLK